MYFIKWIVLFFVFSLCSCVNTHSVNKEQLSYEDFKTNLKPTMDYVSVLNLFGKPESDTGNGLHLLVYNLSDSTKVVVCCASYILFARHDDKNRQVIEELF